jgi:predicted transcriptional regulator
MPAHAQDSAHRLSVSLSAEQHKQLSEIARKNRVSVAWVVREAVERLLKDDLPLLHVGNE